LEARFIKYLLLIAVLSYSKESFGQASFTISGDGNYCLEEQIEFVNGSNLGSYIWDFCSGDMESPPSINEMGVLTAANRPFGFSLVRENENWYAFMTSSDGTDKLTRLDFGSSLDNLPTVVELNNPGSLLSFPEDIDLIKIEGSWYAVVALPFAAVKGVVVYDFGSDIENTLPTGTFLGNFGFTSSIRGLSVVYDGANIIMGITHQTFNISLINFRNSFQNSISVSDIETTPNLTGASTIYSIDLIKKPSNWYALIASENNLNVLDFGSTLFQQPVEDRSYFFDDIGSVIFDIDGVTENDTTYVLASDLNNSPVLLDLGKLENSNPPSQSSEVFPILTDLSIVYSSGRYSLAGIDRTAKNLTTIHFENSCGESVSSSSSIQPPKVAYSSAGVHTVSLSEFTDGEISSSNANLVDVSPDIAPSISFAIDENICISTPNTFTPSILGLSYTWDFGDGSMPAYANDEAPIHQYSLPGTYTVRLDVNDGTCDNFTEQEITIYPVLPTPTFTVPANECKNTLVSFISTTDSSQHLGVLTYEWDFNGEGASTDQDPTFAFTTPGTKQITLKTLIPGCENTSSIFEIDIADGPTSAFNPSSLSICEGETISFTDVSTNGPISWSWDFDDGFTSTTQNPNHLFSTAGSRDVALTVTDALGCESTLTQEVSVSALPVVSFDFNVPCTSVDGIQFMDLSTVSGGSIVSRTWYIGDTPLAEAQDQQNPLLSFAAEGTVNVRLETVSSSGCEASHSEDIQILASPQPEFSMNIGCQGDESLFTDLSVSPGNQVTSWLWRLDGVEYATEDINHTFSGAGMFDVTLEVTGQNFCSETITKSIEVLELLTVDFDVNGDCSNELVELSDQSVVLQDPIVSREWSLDGTSVGNGAELVLESLPDNTYDIMLEVTTASGCVVNTSSSLVINQAPESSIFAEKTFGVPGDAITFTNQSTGGSSYHWLFNGVSVSDNAVEETFTFPDAGTYEISMVSGNDLGCSDTTTTSVLIAIPSVDLSVGQFEIVGTGNVGTIFLEIQNNSNLPIDNTEVSVQLEDQFSVTEQITSVIDVGESLLINLSIGVPLNVDQLSYLCVRVNSQYKGFDDNSPLDNEKCIAIQPKTVIEAPFPNPVRDQVRVRVVTPEESSATLTVLNAAGKVEIEKSVQTQAGLNNFFVDLKALTTGIYFIRIQAGEKNSVQRIIKL